MIGDLIVLIVIFTSDYVPKAINFLVGNTGALSQSIYFFVVVSAFLALIYISFQLGRSYRKKPRLLPLEAETGQNLVEMRLRRRLDKLEDILKGVEDEYWSLAITQNIASKSLTSIIVKMIEAGKSFRFLIINSQPNSLNQSIGRAPGGEDIVSGEREPEYLKESEGKILHEHIDADPKASLKRFRDSIMPELKKKLADDEIKRLFQVREYNLPITHTLIIIDPDSPHARAQLEVFHYVPVEGEQLVFTIEKAKNPDEFAILVKDFENAWNDTKTHPVDWLKL